MKTLGINGIKILKIIHLLCAIAWIGGALCMMLLLLTITPTEGHEMYMRSFILKRIDDWLIIPGANGCILTGIVYGIWTKWGFFKHHWLTVKWVLTIFMVLSGTFIMGPCVNGNVYDVALYSPENSEFWDNISRSIPWGILQNILLIVVIIISVYKPWKNKVKN